MPESNEADSAFFTEVQTLRERARRSLKDGAVTPNYEGDVSKAIELLQSVVASELVCVLRYRMHAIAVSGIDSDSVSEEFAEHAESEHKHMLMAAERIDQLGGVPNFNPDGLLSRSATEYGGDGNLVDMVRQNLVAERVVIEHYRELIRYFAEKDPTTGTLSRPSSPTRKSTRRTCTICWSHTRASRSWRSEEQRYPAVVRTSDRSGRVPP